MGEAGRHWRWRLVMVVTAFALVVSCSVRYDLRARGVTAVLKGPAEHHVRIVFNEIAGRQARTAALNVRVHGRCGQTFTLTLTPDNPRIATRQLSIPAPTHVDGEPCADAGPDDGDVHSGVGESGDAGPTFELRRPHTGEHHLALNFRDCFGRDACEFGATVIVTPDGSDRDYTLHIDAEAYPSMNEPLCGSADTWEDGARMRLVIDDPA